MVDVGNTPLLEVEGIYAKLARAAWNYIQREFLISNDQYSLVLIKRRSRATAEKQETISLKKGKACCSYQYA